MTSIFDLRRTPTRTRIEDYYVYFKLQLGGVQVSRTFVIFIPRDSPRNVFGMPYVQEILERASQKKKPLPLP